MKRLFSVLICTTACSDIKSSALNTSGIHADISAMVEDNQTKVEVILRAGGENSSVYVELEGGDSLEATDGNDIKTLGHSSFGVFHSYTSTFLGTTPETEYTISLQRETETEAPISIAVLTEDFSITTPSAGTVHSRQEPLPISWEAVSPDNETLFLEASGTCIFTITKELSLSDGSYTINNSDFNSINEEEAQESCEVVIKLERRKGGTLDPAYGSGTIFGGVRKTQTIRLDP
jgi:hypothetical protein